MADDQERRVRSAIPLAIVFFVSGGASLLLETLWFRLCGLVFGNSAWASAIVLGSFMAGLAAGNAMAPRLVRRWREPLRIYAGLELAIAVSGFALVLILPALPQVLAPLFRSLLDSPLLNAARLVFAFVLLLVPSTMMGATLPTIVRALSQRDENFGRVLGLLYGCNTMGAVAGALAGEFFLIRVLGIRVTGIVSALASITAAVAAVQYGRSLPATEKTPAQREGAPTIPWRLLIAAGASGFALLALEVIWFRFVILFVVSTSVTFAVMLAVVLAGIGFGALVASRVLSRMPDADRFTPVVAAASVAALVLSYSGFSPYEKGGLVAVIIDALRLMLPVSVLSGFLFTAIGRSVERAVQDDVRAAAMVTFANTVGAAIGPLIAGFVLLPMMGIERSFFAIAALYAVIASLTIRPDVPRMAFAAAGVVAAVSLALFPFGVFRSDFLPLATRAFADAHVVAIREGPVETAVYLRTDYAGEPYVSRLFTNGYSMSATTFASKRYMSAFVYLPVALRPQMRNALLISYGVGVTAKRLTEVEQLQSIDVVDISKDILELSSVVWPGAANPLADPRVSVHVEDGRFFLLTTARRFDLITAEPPPPKSAGVVNLYTREHFQLIRNRLTTDGIASYWLPAYQLSEGDNKAIIRAFCDVFSDCSLWSGAGAEWILIGSRGQARAPAAEEFNRQWTRAISGEQLRRIGIESPAALAATFLADAVTLRSMTTGAAPVTDDHPSRLSPEPVRQLPRFILPFMDSAARRFGESAFVRNALPQETRDAAIALFPAQRLLDRVLMIPLGNAVPPPEMMQSVLTTMESRTLPRILFGSDAWLEEIARRARARGDRDPRLAYILAVGELSERRYDRASSLFAEAAIGMPGNRELREYQKLAATLAR